MKLGLLGEKLGHSYSPQIHKLAFEKLGITGDYNLFERQREDIGELVENIKRGTLDGFNITIPYKGDIISYADIVSPQVEKIGACNTIVREGDRIAAHNTDYFGFMATVKKLECDLTGKKALVLGTGGSAKAVIEVLFDLGAKEVYLATRDKGKATYSRENVVIADYEDVKGISDAVLVVNTTPLGMYPNTGRSALEKETLSNYSYAIDLIYNPKETLFLEYARENGLKYENGLYMLVAQALKADELWLGKSFDQRDIDEIYEKIEKVVYSK